MNIIYRHRSFYREYVDNEEKEIYDTVYDTVVKRQSTLVFRRMSPIRVHIFKEVNDSQMLLGDETILAIQ